MQFNIREENGEQYTICRVIKGTTDLYLVVNSLIEAGISFVYRLKYFLWKKDAFDSTILYVPVHQTDHHPT